MSEDAEGHIPDCIRVERQVGTGRVRVTFSSEDDKREYRVILEPEQALSLLAQVSAKIQHKTITPISRSHLPNSSLQVVGSQVSNLPYGALLINLIAQVDDRVVTVPFELSGEGLDELQAAINNARG